MLRLTFLALSIWSLTTFYAVWLLQKLWQQQGVELSQFGYLWAIYMLVSAGSRTVGAQGRRSDRHDDIARVRRRACRRSAIWGSRCSGVVGGFVAALTFFVARGLGLVVLRDAFNKRLPGHFRATANSLASFGFRAAFAVTGPFVGWTLDLWGMDVDARVARGGVARDLRAVLLPLTLAVRTAATAVVEPASAAAEYASSVRKERPRSGGPFLLCSRCFSRV